MSQECVIEESPLPPTLAADTAASTIAIASAWPVSSSHTAMGTA
jgi:hypothetical protein